jgi:hypothetical protein
VVRALLYCEELTLAGHDDWRLPNVRELLSILDYGRLPPVDSVFGPISPLGWYWSSTPVPSEGAGASGQSLDSWLVRFSGGEVFAGSRARAFHVRAVRGGR